jgi:hypothetical protein
MMLIWFERFFVGLNSKTAFVGAFRPKQIWNSWLFFCGAKLAKKRWRDRTAHPFIV